MKSNTDELKNLRLRLSALAVFRDLLSDGVVEAFCGYLERPSVSGYARFVSKLYGANGGNFSQYVKDICESSENSYVRLIARGALPCEEMLQAVEHELETLQHMALITPALLEEALPEHTDILPGFVCEPVDIIGSFHKRMENIGKYGFGMYALYHMFYLDEQGAIAPVKNPDKTQICDLIGYAAERKIVYDNTLALINGKPAANLLLTGDAGTGKSSTVKAVCNALYTEGLRIIEVRKNQLFEIQKILDELAENPLKFILFIDDLSFVSEDDNFNALKALLEGSVSTKANNIAVYATSNRRHIIRETFSDRDGDEIHRNDSMQELVSLSERFGLRIRFQKPDKAAFLHIVRELAKKNGIDMPQEEIELKAERFALERGGRSARMAHHFINNILSS